MSWSGDVISVIADGYDMSYGARSVKYETERKVVTTLAEGEFFINTFKLLEKSSS